MHFGNKFADEDELAQVVVLGESWERSEDERTAMLQTQDRALMDKAHPSCVECEHYKVLRDEEVVVATRETRVIARARCRKNNSFNSGCKKYDVTLHNPRTGDKRLFKMAERSLTEKFLRRVVNRAFRQSSDIEVGDIIEVSWFFQELGFFDPENNSVVRMQDEHTGVDLPRGHKVEKYIAFTGRDHGPISDENVVTAQRREEEERRAREEEERDLAELKELEREFFEDNTPLAGEFS